MIINALKHLRSAGSERTPERDRDERRGGREKGEREGMVMMCLRMICWIDITNHLVPMVPPLGHTLIHTLSLIQPILSHRNTDINLINISLLHLTFIFKDMVHI